MKILSRLCVACLTLSGMVLPVMAQPQSSAEQWHTLFDGTSLDGWRQAGPGSFSLEDDSTMLSHGGMGLLYYDQASFRDFVLELDWKVDTHTTNSGVFLRFPETDDPWVAVNEGYEVQIDNSRDPDHVTGSIFALSAPFRVTARPAGQWNSYRIEVTGQRYQIWLNGEKVNDFMGDRSREGYIGVQNHDDRSRAWFRNIRVQRLSTPSPMNLAELLATDEDQEEIRVLMVTATAGFRHGAAIRAQKEVMVALSTTTEFRVDTTEDLTQLNTENLARYDVLFLANATLRAPQPKDLPMDEEVGMEGSFANYDIALEIPDNTLAGTLALSGTPPTLTGAIQFQAFPGVSPLTDIVLDGTALSFKWDSGTIGIIEADLTLDGDQLSGTVSAPNMQFPLTGVRAAPASLPTSWQLAITSPQGSVEAFLSLSGTTQGEIVLPEGTSPLQNVQIDSTRIQFRFDAGDFGIIDAEAHIEETSLTGTFMVGGTPIPFTGTAAEAAPRRISGPLITETQQTAIMDFLRSGKGIAIAHSGLDALYHWDDYRAMVGGGLFTSHPWTQSVRITIDEPDSPAVAHFGEDFWIRDEIYVLDENPRWNSRVLMSLDMASVVAEDPIAGTERNDYPISWIRNHNGGRVFVTKLGHFADVWKTPAFLEHILQGMRMVAGRIDANFSGYRVKETIAEDVWPDDLAVDDRGNVWIAELRGKIHHYDASTGEVHQIAHITTTDPTNVEHGLYGIEVDPDFYGGAPYVYLYYAAPETFINTLSRFEYRDGELDLTSEQVLLRVPTEPTCCHQGGDLEWGPDSTLYLSTGDTGMSEVRPGWELTQEQLDAFQARHDLKDYHWSRQVDSERSAQNLQDLRGKILRIHRDGSIPKDNPFFGQAGVRWEVYAYGLRNPYRFKVDPETGVLYIGVVGPDAAFDYDEYNISEQGGENFGWPRTLGRLFYNEWSPDMIPDYVPPMWEYTYETGGRSATVGPIYRHEGPGAFPSLFQNKLFIFDWARRWIKYGDIVDAEFRSDTERDVRHTAPDIRLPAKRLVNIKTFDTLSRTAPISIEQGPDGSIYVAEFDGFWEPGPHARVTRYRWVDGDQSPIGDASILPDPANPRRFLFDATGSYDPDVDTLTYHWDFGDGHYSTEPVATHTYSLPGTSMVRLTVRDSTGRISTPVSIPVTIANDAENVDQ